MGADGTARLWNTGDPGHSPALASLGSEGSYLAAEFGPDGHTLAAAGSDRTTRLWESSAERAAAQVCRRSHPVMTKAEWSRYFGSLAYRPPCP